MDQKAGVHECISLELGLFVCFVLTLREAEYFYAFHDLCFPYDFLVSLGLLPFEVIAQTPVLGLKVLFRIELNQRIVIDLTFMLSAKDFIVALLFVVNWNKALPRSVGTTLIYL